MAFVPPEPSDVEWTDWSEHYIFRALSASLPGEKSRGRGDENAGSRRMIMH